MSIDGIWTVEIYGAFGWESVGILVLQEGRAIGGGNNHYSRGAYRKTKDEVTISVVVDYFGVPRTMFGEKETEFSIEFRGEQEKPGVITGTVVRPDKSVIPLQSRLIRRAGLD